MVRNRRKKNTDMMTMGIIKVEGDENEPRQLSPQYWRGTRPVSDHANFSLWFS